MSQHRLSDLRMVLKGLQKVVRSSLSKQETECSLKWQTSSLKPIIDEILHKLEKSANETCENKQHIAVSQYNFNS